MVPRRGTIAAEEASQTGDPGGLEDETLPPRRQSGIVMPWLAHASSTTVDDELLTQARAVTGAHSDAVLLDQALDALLAHHRRAEIDRAYAA